MVPTDTRIEVISVPTEKAEMELRRCCTRGETGESEREGPKGFSLQWNIPVNCPVTPQSREKEGALVISAADG